MQGGRTPTRDQVRERVAQLLHEIARIPKEQIVDGATLDQDLKMESVVIIEIQVALEDEYDIELDPIEIVELNEFTAIANHIYECTAKPTGR